MWDRTGNEGRQEQECWTGQVMREDGCRKETGREVSSRDTKDTICDRTYLWAQKKGRCRDTATVRRIRGVMI